MIAFRHGVASADPLPDGVLLWTRCSTDARGPLAVDWWVAADPDGSEVAARGAAEASAERDHTVHVDVTGLAPSTTYWYGFATGGARSPVGRTRTAPAPDDPAQQHLRVGLASCASWPCGYFNAYGGLAARDLDLVVHVGDYLYENDRVSRGPRAVRAHRPPGALATLDDYRRRHAQYRTDPDLQALHARHPVVATWDDHEMAGGAWRGGATDHRPSRHGSWEERRAAAVQAYLEWMPVRAGGSSTPVQRRLRLGPLADLVVLDTRLAGRDRPVAEGRAAVRAGGRHRALLDEEQWRWLGEQAASADSRWLLLGNQVVMAPVRALGLTRRGLGVNPGQWDGYPAERDRLYRVLGSAGWGADVAVLSGDLHSSWASDLPIGAEFVAPSVTTDAFATTVLPFESAATLGSWWFRAQNRHVRMAELRRHGYVVVDVTPEAVQADWWHVETVARRHPAERWGGGWRLAHGRPGLEEADGPASSVNRGPAVAPSSRSAPTG